MTTTSSIHSFSSYTKGLYEIEDIKKEDECVIFHIEIPTSFSEELLENAKKHADTRAISLNGAYAEFTIVEEADDDKVRLIAQVANHIFNTSALPALKAHDPVSIGIVSESPDHWLQDGHPHGAVSVVEISTAPGHEYTQQITLECSSSQYRKIQNLNFLGLNGSGLMIQELLERRGRFFFKINAGRETREKTIFNMERLSPGDMVTLSLPFTGSDSSGRSQASESSSNSKFFPKFLSELLHFSPL